MNLLTNERMILQILLKAIENVEMGWFGVGSLKVTGNITIRHSAYKFLLAFCPNRVPFLRYSEI